MQWEMWIQQQMIIITRKNPVENKDFINHDVYPPIIYKRYAKIQLIPRTLLLNTNIVTLSMWVLLAHSHLPRQFWDFAFKTATFLINHLPTRTLHFLSPFQVLHNSSTNYNFLRIFGCLCYPYLCFYTSNKLNFYCCPCIFLGYPSNYHGYRYFDPSFGRIFITCTIIFCENSFRIHQWLQPIILLLLPLMTHLFPFSHLLYHHHQWLFPVL